MKVAYAGIAPMPEALTAHLAGGAETVAGADSEAAVIEAANGAATADVVFLRHRNVADLRSALLGSDGLASRLSRGTTLVDQSDCEPQAFRRLAQELAERGVTLLDAPLSGHLSAESGCAPLLYYSGPAEARARIAPLLAEIFGEIHDCGGTGGAHAMNLLNVTLGVSSQLATLEVAAMGRKFGLGVAAMADVVSKGSGRNRTSATVLPRLMEGKSSSDFPIARAVEILKAATEAGAMAGAPMLASKLALGLAQATLNRFGPKATVEHTIALAEGMAGANLREDGDAAVIPPSPGGKLKVGYLGLGAMGGALARRLLLSRPLTVFDVNAKAVANMAGDGATAAPDAATVARECDVILICVPTSAIVRQAIFGPGGLAEGLSPGKIVIDQTTGDPSETASIAADLAKLGVETIDAPVSGGTRGAVAGTIAVICGGEPAPFARIRPILEQISPNIVHCGGIGAGHAAKLVQNAVAACNRAITLECLAAACKSGLTLTQMIEPIKAGSGWNGGAERIIPALRTDSPTTEFAMGLAVKDLKLACAIGADVGAPMLIANAVRGLYQICANEQGADKNLDQVARTVESMAGLVFVDHA